MDDVVGLVHGVVVVGEQLDGLGQGLAGVGARQLLLLQVAGMLALGDGQLHGAEVVLGRLRLHGPQQVLVRGHLHALLAVGVHVIRVEARVGVHAGHGRLGPGSAGQGQVDELAGGHRVAVLLHRVGLDEVAQIQQLRPGLTLGEVGGGDVAVLIGGGGGAQVLEGIGTLGDDHGHLAEGVHLGGIVGVVHRLGELPGRDDEPGGHGIAVLVGHLGIGNLEVQGRQGRLRVGQGLAHLVGGLVHLLGRAGGHVHGHDGLGGVGGLALQLGADDVALGDAGAQPIEPLAGGDGAGLVGHALVGGGAVLGGHETVQVDGVDILGPIEGVIGVVTVLEAQLDGVVRIAQQPLGGLLLRLGGLVEVVAGMPVGEHLLGGVVAVDVLLHDHFAVGAVVVAHEQLLAGGVPRPVLGGQLGAAGHDEVPIVHEGPVVGEEGHALGGNGGRVGGHGIGAVAEGVRGTVGAGHRHHGHLLIGALLVAHIGLGGAAHEGGRVVYGHIAVVDCLGIVAVEGHAVGARVGIDLEERVHDLLEEALVLVLVVLVLHSLAGIHVSIGRAAHGIEVHLGHEDEGAVDAGEGVVVRRAVEHLIAVEAVVGLVAVGGEGAARGAEARQVQGRLAERV